VGGLFRLDCEPVKKRKAYKLRGEKSKPPKKERSAQVKREKCLGLGNVHPSRVGVREGRKVET